MVYLLLQDQYLKMILEKKDYTEEEGLEALRRSVPSGFAYLDHDKKNILIAQAIREKISLTRIFDQMELERFYGEQTDEY